MNADYDNSPIKKLKW